MVVIVCALWAQAGHQHSLEGKTVSDGSKQVSLDMDDDLLSPAPAVSGSVSMCII